MAEAGSHDRKDWVGGFRSFALAWGLPIAALIGAIFLGPVPKTVTSVVALTWMGAACIAQRGPVRPDALSYHRSCLMTDGISGLVAGWKLSDSCWPREPWAPACRFAAGYVFRRGT